MKKLFMIIAIMAGFTVSANAQSFDSKETKEIEKVVENYLLTNPKIIITALEKYQEMMEAEQKKKAIEVLNINRKEIEGGEYFLGNKDGKIKIVKFFDYNCGYCRIASKTLKEKMEKDKDIKLVLKELPSLSEESVEVAKIAMASVKQGKYEQMHAALMAGKGAATKESALELAKTLKLDIEKLKKDAEDKALLATILENRKLASALGSQAVPTIVIGDEVIVGTISSDDLDKKVKQLKDNKEKGKQQKGK